MTLLRWEKSETNDLQPLYLEFLEFFSGPWIGFYVVHYCRGIGCPQCGGCRAAAFKKACFLTQQVIFSVLPVVPILSRWTKIIDAFDFWIMSICFHGILPSLIALAWSGDEFAYEAAADMADLGLEADVDFRRLRGQRFKKLMATLSRSHLAFHVLSAAVILNGTRYIGSWILKSTSGRRSGSDSRLPVLCDLVSIRNNPIHVAQQHFSAVLATRSPWQRLFRAYIADDDAWETELQHTFRRLVVHAVVHTHRRHTHRFSRFEAMMLQVLLQFQNKYVIMGVRLRDLGLPPKSVARVACLQTTSSSTQMLTQELVMANLKHENQCNAERTPQILFQLVLVFPKAPQ